MTISSSAPPLGKELSADIFKGINLYISIALTESSKSPDALSKMSTPRKADRKEVALCTKCIRLDSLLALADQSRRYNEKMLTTFHLGSIKEVVRKERCEGCQAIADLFRSLDDPMEPDTDLKAGEFVFECDIDHQREGLFQKDNYKPDKRPVELRFWIQYVSGRRRSVSLYFKDRVHPNEDIGRISSPNNLDMEGIREWIRCCNEHHPECWKDSAATSASELPPELEFMYLIDLEQDCIIKAYNVQPYAALSYVWGQVDFFRLTKRSVDRAMRRHSLRENTGSIRIPKTIRDVMSVVKMLGIPYLWVDAFCIVQDDELEMQQSLRAMGSIYSSAYLTIVAAEGEGSSHGLSGISHSVRDQHDANRMLPFPACDLVAVLGQQAEVWPYGSTWDRRAWTYQETLFSRRLLIFRYMVSWCCKTDEWSEGIQSRVEGVPHLRQSIAAERSVRKISGRLRGFPDLDLWRSIVQNYHKRKLSYDGDVLDAIAGVTQELSMDFPGGFHFGLPVIFFDIALLWQDPEWIESHRGVETRGTLDLPSWSWTGWSVFHFSLVRTFTD